MDDVEVPKSNMLNVEGLKGPFSCLKCVALAPLLARQVLTYLSPTATPASASASASSARSRRRSR